MPRPPLRSALVVAALAAAAARADDVSVPGADAHGGSGKGDGVAAPSESLRARAKVPGRAARAVRLPPLDVARLRREDEESRSGLGDEWKRWNRVGVERALRPVAVPPTPSRWGRAETLADGSRVFRVTVAAPGAEGLRLRLRARSLPKGAEVTIHDADQPDESYGPLRVPMDGDAWLTPTVFGSRAVLAVRVPAHRLDERVRLVVDGVVQRYRPPEEFSGDGPEGSAGGGPAAKSRAVLSCIKSVACDADHLATVSRGVARLEFLRGGNSYLCSGTLLNDLDVGTEIPWFLTANHCIATDKSARSIEFFWDYRADACGGAVPDLYDVPRTLGATLVSTSATTDTTLVRITGQLPSNRFYCGWTSARPAVGSPVTGVHHPEATHMRISRGAIDATAAGTHRIVWSDGVTAEGSSGSAIFNASRQVIGALSSGSSYCRTPRAPDFYGRFDVAYPAILADHLGDESEPAGPDAWDPGDGAASGATDLGAPPLGGLSHGPHTLFGSDAEDWFRVTLEAGVPYTFSTDAAVRGALWSDEAAAEVVVAETGGAAGFEILAVPAASGPHWLRVRRAVPGDDQSYLLRAERQDAAPPRVAGRLRARSSAGVVTLTWLDRARRERGYRVEFLGSDGWIRVGELPPNAARFRHRPGPGVHVYRVGPWDPVTTTWREVAVRVRGRPGLDPWDPRDDTGAGATPLPREATHDTETRELDRNDAADWYRIDLVAGETWTVRTLGDSDTTGTVYADAGGLSPLDDGDDQTDPSGAVTDYDFRIEFTAPATGTYWLEVRAYPTTPRATYVLRTELE